MERLRTLAALLILLGCGTSHVGRDCQKGEVSGLTGCTPTTQEQRDEKRAKVHAAWLAQKEESKKVRLTRNTDLVRDCKALGVVEGYAWYSRSEGIDPKVPTATEDVALKTLKLGGNTAVLSGEERKENAEYTISVRMSGEAYSCPPTATSGN